MMTGKQRVLAAMKLQPTDMVPWIPFVGAHGGKLLGLTATDYLKSADRLVEGVSKAIELYQPDGVPVAFDLQIEAEVLGCDLNWSDDTPPAVVTHPLSAAGGKTLADIPLPSMSAGRIPVVMETARRLRKAYPDLALYGLITGPFTLALHLMGTDIFMTMFDAPEKIEQVMDFARQVCCRMSDAYVEAGCDIIAVVDPMTSQIGPDQFKQFVSPHAKPLFDHIRSIGAMGSFFVCGHAEQNLHVMCDCKPDNISVDENISLATIKSICLPSGVSYGGNMQLTSVLLLGTEIDAKRNALACLEIAGKEPGFLLAPGCDLPFDTPPANLAAIAPIVRDEYARQALKAMAVEETKQDLLDLSDYGQCEKVVVDIITLDSEACAPCQYMVESVRQIAPEFEGIVEWREHKIKYRESLVFMTSLMVRNVPTICIDGQITFVSRIPARDELIRAIQRRIIEKLRVRIAQKRGELFLLCSESHCPAEKCEELRDTVQKATAELGTDIPLKMIRKDDEILSFGVLPAQTPALVSAKYQVRATHQIPDRTLIREWLKDIE